VAVAVLQKKTQQFKQVLLVLQAVVAVTLELKLLLLHLVKVLQVVQLQPVVVQVVVEPVVLAETHLLVGLVTAVSVLAFTHHGYLYKPTHKTLLGRTT
jgi:hypothetical protein